MQSSRCLVDWAPPPLAFVVEGVLSRPLAFIVEGVLIVEEAPSWQTRGVVEHAPRPQQFDVGQQTLLASVVERALSRPLAFVVGGALSRPLAFIVEGAFIVEVVKGALSRPFAFIVEGALIVEEAPSWQTRGVVERAPLPQPYNSEVPFPPPWRMQSSRCLVDWAPPPLAFVVEGALSQPLAFIVKGALIVEEAPSWQTRGIVERASRPQQFVVGQQTLLASVVERAPSRPLAFVVGGALLQPLAFIVEGAFIVKVVEGALSRPFAFIVKGALIVEEAPSWQTCGVIERALLPQQFVVSRQMLLAFVVERAPLRPLDFVVGGVLSRPLAFIVEGAFIVPEAPSWQTRGAVERAPLPQQFVVRRQTFRGVKSRYPWAFG
jgi:hypothetical protein